MAVINTHPEVLDAAARACAEAITNPRAAENVDPDVLTKAVLDAAVAEMNRLYAETRNERFKLP